MQTRRPVTIPPAGATVRLTAAFLRSTGQYTGDEPFARWTVISCDCELCQTTQRVGEWPIVAVDQRYEYMPDQWRHIAAGNLEVIRSR